VASQNNTVFYADHHSVTALFWLITQRVVVISYRRFVTAYRSHSQCQESKSCWFLNPEDWTHRLSRHIGTKVPLLAA